MDTVKEIIYTCKSLYIFFFWYKDLYVYRQYFFSAYLQEVQQLFADIQDIQVQLIHAWFSKQKILHFHFQTLSFMASIPMHTVLSSARYGCADLMP